MNTDHHLDRMNNPQPDYFAAQSTGKIHRVPSASMGRTLCGITTVGTLWAFWRDDDGNVNPDACVRCWRPAPMRPTQAQTEAARHATTATTDGLDAHVEELIVDHITRATAAYRWNAPGHGEFILERLRMRLERIERVTS